jgi:hypothetical protein
MSRVAGQPPRCGLESAKRYDIIGFQRDARALLKVATGIILPP